MTSLNKKEVYKALSDDETYATVLHAICLLTYGEEMYTLDSLELYARLQDDFGVAPTEENESKLMSMIIAVSTPYFYHDLEVFKTISTVLTSGDTGLTDLEIEEPSLLEIFWALYEVGLNAEELDFSKKISKYLAREVAEEAEETGMEAQDVKEDTNEILYERARDLTEQLALIGFPDVPPMPQI